MMLDCQVIANSFNELTPSNVFGFSIDYVRAVCGLSPSRWRHYHKLIRDAENYLLKQEKKPLGFSYGLRSQGLDKKSFLLLFSLIQIQKFFHNERLSIQELYKNWEKIKCHVQL